MTRPPPPDDYDDNPEWAESDFASARPAGKVLPPEVVAALVKGPADPLRDELIERIAQARSGMKSDRFAAAKPWFRNHYRAVARQRIDAAAASLDSPIGAIDASDACLIGIMTA